MAVTAPSVGAVGTYLAGADRTTAAVPVPTGMAADEVALVVLYIESTATISRPTGFEQYFYGGVGGDDAHRIYVAWKRASAADSGTYSFSWSGTAWAEGQCFRIADVVDSGDPIRIMPPIPRGAWETELDTDATDTPTVGLNDVPDGDLIVWMATNFNGGTCTPPSGYTKKSGGTAPSMAVAVKEQTAEGDTPGLVGSWSVGSAQIALVLSFMPVPSADVSIDGELTAVVTSVPDGTVTTEQNADPELLAAAIASPTRTMIHSVSISWPAGVDLPTEVGPWVEKLSYDRAYATTLPTEFRVAEGLVSASGQLTLGGPEGSPPMLDDEGVPRPWAWWVSAHNADGPLYRKQRLKLPVTIGVGPAGFTPVRQFTGYLRDMTVNSKGGTVDFILADGAEDLRGQVSIPGVIRSRQAVGSPQSGDLVSPGLNAQWPINYIIRDAGILTSPAAHDDTVVEVSFHGSAWPELSTETADTGELVSVAQARSLTVPEIRTTLMFVDSGDGFMALPIVSRDLGTAAQVDGFLPETDSTADTLQWQLWVRFAEGAYGLLVWYFGETPNTATPQAWFELLDDGNLKASFQRFQGATVVSDTITSSALTADAWHYVAVAMSCSSSDITITARVDDLTHDAVTLTASQTSTTPAFTRWRVGRKDLPPVVVVGGTAGPLAEILGHSFQVRTGDGAYDNGFTPQATLEASLLELVTMPTVSGDGWSILKDIASAEEAIVGFDEAGQFFYRNRKTFQSVAGWTTDTPAITSTTNLKDLSATESIDSIQTRVSLDVQPYALGDFEIFWQLDETIFLEHGQSRTFVIPLDDGPVFGVQKPVRNFGPAEVSTTTGGSGYSSSRNPAGTAGSGVDLPFTLNVYADRVELTVTNVGRSRTYLTWPNGSGVGASLQGKPALFLSGQQAKSGEKFTLSHQVDEQVDEFGLRDYSAPSSAWRQNSDGGDQLVYALAYDLAYPLPTIGSIPIVGDPRIKLGTLRNIEDPDGLVVLARHRVVGIHSELVKGMFSQTISAKPVDNPGGLILDGSTVDLSDIVYL